MTSRKATRGSFRPSQPGDARASDPREDFVIGRPAKPMAPATAWWVGVPADEFSRAAQAELPRLTMNASKVKFPEPV